MPTGQKMVLKRLVWEYKDIIQNPIDGICAGPVNDDDLFTWEAWIRGPEDSPYAHGCFRCELKFPSDFPIRPPTMKFTSKLWHPNVYADGNVCISILHYGEDPTGYEQRCERWSPILSVSKILISVVSMLAAPNNESPANLDAARQRRNDPKAFEARVEQDVLASLGLTLQDVHTAIESGSPDIPIDPETKKDL